MNDRPGVGFKHHSIAGFAAVDMKIMSEKDAYFTMLAAGIMDHHFTQEDILEVVDSIIDLQFDL